MPNENTINIFIAYSREDAEILKKLRTNLKVLERTQNVNVWYDGEIEAGSDWEKSIKTHLYTADIILLLVTENFIASDYCYDVEMKEALSLHDQDKVRSIPIIAKECLWQDTPFARLQALPEDGKALTSSDWSNPNRPYLNVVEELRSICQDIRNKRKALSSDNPSSTTNEIINNPTSDESSNKKKILIGLMSILVLVAAGWGFSQFGKKNTNDLNPTQVNENPTQVEEDTPPENTDVASPPVKRPSAEIINNGTKLKDNRNQKTYTIAKLADGNIWMTQNLNFDLRGASCYNGDEAICENGYGRLYTWDAALTACPEGWHLPSKEEWETIIAKYGGQGTEEGYDNLVNGPFNAFLSGFRYMNRDDAIYQDKDSAGYYWTSTPDMSGYYAYYSRFRKGRKNSVTLNTKEVETGRSCRCVKDKD